VTDQMLRFSRPGWVSPIRPVAQEIANLEPNRKASSSLTAWPRSWTGLELGLKAASETCAGSSVQRIAHGL
jgi:hypothetical protein